MSSRDPSVLTSSHPSTRLHAHAITSHPVFFIWVLVRVRPSCLSSRCIIDWTISSSPPFHFLQQDQAVQFKLAFNAWSSCLSFLSDRRASVCHHVCLKWSWYLKAYYYKAISCEWLFDKSNIFLFSSGNKTWPCEMAQQVQALATMPDGLNLILETHMMEDEIQLP